MEMTWEKVRKGFVVADKTGREWTVIAAGGGEFTISSPGQKTWTGKRSGLVRVVSQPAPQNDPNVDLAVAQGLVATKFGGIEIYKQGKDKTKPKRTPVSFPEPGSLLAHLRIFHNALSDEPSLAGLEKVHAELHGPEHKTADLYEPHTHDPDYETL
jgi:hypothetical protein